MTKINITQQKHIDLDTVKSKYLHDVNKKHKKKETKKKEKRIVKITSNKGWLSDPTRWKWSEKKQIGIQIYRDKRKSRNNNSIGNNSQNFCTKNVVFCWKSISESMVFNFWTWNHSKLFPPPL